MTKIDRILKRLSELYEFNRKLKAFELKKKGNNSRPFPTGANRWRGHPGSDNGHPGRDSN